MVKIGVGIISFDISSLTLDKDRNHKLIRPPLKSILTTSLLLSIVEIFINSFTHHSIYPLNLFIDTI
jgi:hypothetical protein